MRIIMVLALGMALAAPSAALAKGGKPDKGWGNPGKPGGPPGHQGYRGGPPGQVKKFAGGDYSVIRAYYGQAMRYGNCPPGLAKKHNGCRRPAMRSAGSSVNRWRTESSGTPCRKTWSFA